MHSVRKKNIDEHEELTGEVDNDIILEGRKILTIIKRWSKNITEFIISYL